MTTRPSIRRCSGRERGVALVCALVLMLAAMLVGVSVARAAFAASASAGAERERALARAAAEATLRDAERDLFAAPGTARADHFGPAGATDFVAGCGRGPSDRGLCLETAPPAWQALDLAEAGHPGLVPYGYYTGATLAVGEGLLPARLPAYLIERILPPGASAELGSFYRITAIGYGSRDATRVVLQAVVRKPKPAAAGGGGGGPAPASPPDSAGGPLRGQAGGHAQAAVQLPAGRIGWREIGNWAQLHRQAVD